MLSSALSETETTIYKLEVAQKEGDAVLGKEVLKLGQELSNRLNDQVWREKFEGFHERQIRPIVQRMEENAATAQGNLERSREESMRKFAEVEVYMMKNRNEMAIRKRGIDKINEEGAEMQGLIQGNKE